MWGRFKKKEVICPFPYRTGSRCSKHDGSFVTDNSEPINIRAGQRGHYKDVCLTGEYPNGRAGVEYCRIAGQGFWRENNGW